MPDKQPEDLLEPDAMKVARPVLRGEWPSDGLLLPDYASVVTRSGVTSSALMVIYRPRARGSEPVGENSPISLIGPVLRKIPYLRSF